MIEAEDGGNSVRSQPSTKSQSTLTVTITNVNDVTVTNVAYVKDHLINRYCYERGVRQRSSI